MHHSTPHHAPSYADPAHLDGVHMTATFLGTLIGAITLTGSAVAFGKLHGLLPSAPLSLPGGCGSISREWGVWYREVAGGWPPGDAAMLLWGNHPWWLALHLPRCPPPSCRQERAEHRPGSGQRRRGRCLPGQRRG